MKSNKLAERLREMRVAKGLTQREMARVFHLSDVGYGGWERGSSEPSLDNLMRLCEFFGCSADSLLGFTPLPSTPNTSRLEELKTRLASLSKEIESAENAIDLVWRK